MALYKYSILFYLLFITLFVWIRVETLIGSQVNYEIKIKTTIYFLQYNDI